MYQLEDKTASISTDKLEILCLLAADYEGQLSSVEELSLEWKEVGSGRDTQLMPFIRIKNLKFK